MAIASASPILILTLTLTLTLVSCLLLPSSYSAADGSFDIRRHLSTVTRYEAGKDAKRSLAVYQPSAIPDGCAPFHLNLVARHGTCAPTRKRIIELDRLATRLDSLMSEAKQGTQDKSLQKIPSWLSGWKSPWKGLWQQRFLSS